MIKRILLIASVALQTLRANPLHTLLSTSGLVVGVAALVAILSLGDGLEQYARNQISTTTSLEGIIVQPKTRMFVDGVSVARKSIPMLQTFHADSIANILEHQATLVIKKSMNVLVSIEGDTARTGAYVEATQPALFDMMRAELVAGRYFGESKTQASPPELVLSYVLAHRLAKYSQKPEDLIGHSVTIDETPGLVVGVLEGSVEDKYPAAYGLLDSWGDAIENNTPHNLVVRAENVEDVPLIEKSISAWLDQHMVEGSEAFKGKLHIRA